MTSDWNGPQQQPQQQPQQYRQQQPQQGYPPQQHPQQQPPPQQQNRPPAKPKMPGWAVALLVIGVLNLLLAGYLVYFVVQAQVALSELQGAFESGFNGGLGG